MIENLRVGFFGGRVGASIVTLFRELTEETGFALDAGGEWMVVGDSIRKRLCETARLGPRQSTRAFLQLMRIGPWSPSEHPPLAPVRYTNRFYHIHFGKQA